MRRLLVVAAILVMTMAGRAHAARTESYGYVAGPGDLVALNCDGNLKVTETTLGGTCFDILLDDASVSLKADDATGVSISLTYSFRNAAGEDMSDFPQFCGAIDDLAIPAGATSLVVYIDTALAAFSPCDGTPGTAGTITATYA